MIGKSINKLRTHAKLSQEQFAALFDVSQAWIEYQSKSAYCTAEMAWRDASISHTKNGIYGEMFVLDFYKAGNSAQDCFKAIYEKYDERNRKHPGILDKTN